MRRAAAGVDRRWWARRAIGSALVWASMLAGVPAAAQEQLASAPRFLVAPRGASGDAATRWQDASRLAVFQQRISVDLRGVPLEVALREVGRQSGLWITYSPSVIRAEAPVTLSAQAITVGAALSALLYDAGVDVLLTANRQAVIVARDERRLPVGIVAGWVTDSATGAPIADAEVRVVGTQVRAMSGDSGQYVLRDVPVGEQRVSVRRIGYEAQTRWVAVTEGGTTTLVFALNVVATRLDELVTTVTGDQRRLEVGNTIVSLNADSLMQIAPVMSMGDLLQGRAPGVLSFQESGNAGKAGRFRLRGLNSALIANDPVVIVDGARVEAGAGTTSSGVSNSGGFTGRLADLDPDEIQSVEVVKGPSAATLYGTDAANGVIVITTKRGQPGRTRWAAFTEQGRLHQGLDLTDAFTDAYYAFGRSTADDAPQRCTLLERAGGSCVFDSLATFNTFTDPATRPFKDSHRQQYGLQASGGTADGTTYFLSGDYEQEIGTQFMPEIDQALIQRTQGRAPEDWQVRPNASERVNLRANLTAPLGRRGSATLATGFVSNHTRMAGSFPFNQVGYRDANDGWIDFGGPNNVRPAYQFARRDEDVVRRFTGSLATTYNVRDWLTVRGTVGADLSTNAFGTLLRRGEQPTSTGSRTATELGIARYSLDLGATATRALSTAVSSKTSVGLQYNRRAQRGAMVFANNLPLGGETLAGATVRSTEEATLSTAVAGGYVEQMFGLQDRLFLTGALRFDGGSTFGENFSVAAYPKASLSWVVTDGQAGPRLPGVNALRLRAAYGASGVQPGPTDALSLVTVQNGINLAGTAAAPGGFLVGGNPDLKPERSSELEAGLDLELWQSRVHLEFTAYQRTSTDALVSRPNGIDVGGSRIENLGSVRNRGLELLLSADLVRGRTLAAGFTATGMLNANELRRLGEDVVPRNPVAEAAFGALEVGYPLFGLWGFTIEGFADANGNGIIEPTEIVFSGPNSSFLGSSFPTREATLAPYVKLFGERLHLSGLLQYRGGFYRTNLNSIGGPCFGVRSSCRGVNDLATSLAEQARAVAYSSFFYQGPFMDDGSYLLWRELSLGLTVPASLTRVLGARGGHVVLAGRNLALLWKASSVPVENAILSSDNQNFTGQGPGPSTYWLLRVHLNY